MYRLEGKFTWMRRGKVYKTSCEVEFGITSLSREKASPEKVLAVRRKHWLIETGLHYRRDVTFHEDAIRMTKGAQGEFWRWCTIWFWACSRWLVSRMPPKAEGGLPDTFRRLSPA